MPSWMLQMQQLHQEYDMLVWRAYKNIWTSMCAYLVRVGSPRRQSEILGHNAIPQGPGGPTLVWHCTQGFLLGCAGRKSCCSCFCSCSCSRSLATHLTLTYDSPRRTRRVLRRKQNHNQTRIKILFIFEKCPKGFCGRIPRGPPGSHVLIIART